MRNTFVVAILYLFVLIGAALGVYFLSSDVIRENQERMLTLEREYVKLEIEHHFHTVETILYDVEAYVLNHDDDTDLFNYLVAIQEDSDLMYSIYLGRPDKTMVNSSGFVPGPDFDLTTRIWYQLAINSDMIVFTPVFLNATEDRLIITAAKAIYDDQDNLIGVLATDIDTLIISEFVASTQIGDTGFAFLVDNNGILVGYPDMDLETLSLVPASTFSNDLDLLSGSGTLLKTSVQGVSGALSYTAFVYDYYLLGVFMPQPEFSQSSTLFSTLIIIFGIVLVISSLFFYTVYVRNVSLPLKHLLEDILRINVEHNPEFRLSEDEHLGYANVRSALNKVLVKTSHYLTENLSIQDQLTLDNQRVTLLMNSAADIIFEIDTSKRFVSIFGRGLEKIGHPASVFIGRTVLDCFGADGIERDIAYTKALNGEHMIYDWTYVKDGTPLYFESTIAPIYNKSNQVVGAVGISRDITEPMKRQKEIEHISNHDYLTGIYNRRFFSSELARMDVPQNLPLGLILLDMNALKMFNDAFGHDVGDEALKQIANTLKESLSGNEIAARTGGDEFAIIFPRASEEAIAKLIDRIRANLAKVNLHGMPLSVAIGDSLKKSMTEDIESLIKFAENDMYTNKFSEGKLIRNQAIEAIMSSIFKMYPEEKNHAEGVSNIAFLIGEKLNLRKDELGLLKKAAYYHDIGKIGISKGILYKPSSLSAKEYGIIKGHCENGYHLLRGAIDYLSLAESALSHHERWDGKGYPSGIAGEKIPLMARIIAIADAYEAMTSDRAHRKALSKEAAIKELKSVAGTQLDSEIVKVFIETLMSD